MRRFMYLFAALIAVPLMFTGCRKASFGPDEFYQMYGNGAGEVGTYLEKLSHQRIYFGHQSVGFNMVDGIQRWEEETGVDLSKEVSRDFSKGSGAALVHFQVGRNQDPLGKIEDFKDLVSRIPEEEQAAAFFKFCFIDFYPDTDLDDLFVTFKEEMLSLRDQYPNVRFLVATVPYTAVQKGWRALAKKILGRAPYGYLENIPRYEFNQRIHEELEGVFPVFDLGAVEVTRPDGTVETYSYKGKEYPCIPDSYTSDYGHLNEIGARTVSYNLLAFLSEELE